MKGGADLSLQDNEGRNALMIAIELKQFFLVKYLTASMSVSESNMQDRYGRTAAVMAIINCNGDYSCLEHADLNMQDIGLHAAVMAVFKL